MRKSVLIAALVAVGALSLVVGGGQALAATHYSYTLVDPGTFGGPQSFLNLPAVPLTKDGILLGTADTTVPDDDYPNFNPFMVGFPDPFLAQAFEWRDGQLINLGALPGNNSSAVFEVNGSGVGVGMSETATTDPYTGWPADNAVMFKDGQVINLGTLPGGYESQATDINDRGQVSGFASNGIPDEFSFFGWGTQARSFIWQNGVMQDIGTLGGPDAVMTTLNARGQITGQSYTNATANDATGMPTLDPFLWENGHMQDLGTLGGTVGFANWMNDRGEVVGQSNLTGDQTTHPFLWNGKGMIDLGTLGGDNGNATWVSNSGAVAGIADLPGSTTHHAFLWKNGVKTDLGVLPGCQTSGGSAVNDRDQVVGGSRCPGSINAFLWDHGQMKDLNSLVAPSDLHLQFAEYIDNQGDIVGTGFLPNGDQHVYLLIPNTN
jgi:probable HAF family extracellular repeat protein